MKGVMGKTYRINCVAETVQTKELPMIRSQANFVNGIIDSSHLVGQNRVDISYTVHFGVSGLRQAMIRILRGGHKALLIGCWRGGARHGKLCRGQCGD